MKANLLILSLMTLTATVNAAEVLNNEDGGAQVIAYAYEKPDFKAQIAMNENEKDMKIATLNKLLDQQQHMYEEKVTFLEEELKKSKDRLVEKSINHDKMKDVMEKRFTEESTYLKKELVSKTKTLMEYQRQLEKMKPSEDMKQLIKLNTELALENRKAADQLAMVQLKENEAVAKTQETKAATGGRMPASVETAK